MNDYLTGLAACLQVIFTTTATALGRATGFIRRQRELTAAGFAQTLVFQWMAQPQATLETLARELELSPQALQQRCGPQAQALLRALLAEALQKALQAPRQRLGLLQRFTAVLVEDTTTITVPAALADAFPGCGGGSGAGGLVQERRFSGGSRRRGVWRSEREMKRTPGASATGATDCAAPFHFTLR